MANPTTVVINLTGSDKTGAAWASANKRVANHRRKVKGLLGTYQRIKTQVTQLNSALGLMPVAGMAGMVAAASLFSKSILSARMEMDTFNNSMFVATGDMKAGEKEFEKMSKLSERLGLDLVTTADSYRKFSISSRAAGLSERSTTNIFEGVSTAVAAVGLSSEKTSRVFVALEQMMSKGTVSAEELKQQMGEHLPGSMSIAAKAMGLTTREFQKALAAGKIMADDFLPKFARALKDKFGGAAVLAADQFMSATNRMGNAWLELKLALGDKEFMDAATVAVKKITDILKDPAVASGIKKTFTNLIAGFTWMLDNKDKVTAMFAAYAASILVVAGPMKILAAAVAGMAAIVGSDLIAKKTKINTLDTLLWIEKEIFKSEAKLTVMKNAKLTEQNSEEMRLLVAHLKAQYMVRKVWQDKARGIKKAPIEKLPTMTVTGDAPPDPFMGALKLPSDGLSMKFDFEEATEGVETFKDKFRELAAPIMDMENLGLQFIGSFADGLSTQLTEALMTGKASFGDFARSILAMITQMIIKMLIFKAISGLVNAFSGGGGTVASGLTSQSGSAATQGFGQLGNANFFSSGASGLATPFGNAAGGRVKGGRSIMVGEAGREVFVPGEDGRIVPNHNVKTAQAQDQAMTENVNITLNLSTGVQSTVRAEIMGMMPIITKQVKNSVAEARQRGGSFSSRMGVA